MKQHNFSDCRSWMARAGPQKVSYTVTYIFSSRNVLMMNLLL
jgi:hypothetical protein